MKKKILALALVVVLAITAVTGATLAYFTDVAKDVENVFAIGDLNIILDETVSVEDKDGEEVKDAVRKTDGGANYSGLMPTYHLTKKPVVSNTGSTEAYVRVAVRINNAYQRNAAIDATYETAGKTQTEIQSIYDNIFEGWGINNTAAKDGIDGYKNGIRNSMRQRTDDRVINIDSVRIPYAGGTYQWEKWNMFQSESEKTNGSQAMNLPANGYYANAVDENSNLYVFYLKLAPNATYVLFDGLNIPSDFTADQMKMFTDLKIDIHADAIQTVGFDTAEDAFTALEAAHPLGWWKTTTEE